MYKIKMDNKINEILEYKPFSDMKIIDVKGGVIKLTYEKMGYKYHGKKERNKK